MGRTDRTTQNIGFSGATWCDDCYLDHSSVCLAFALSWTPVSVGETLPRPRALVDGCQAGRTIVAPRSTHVRFVNNVQSETPDPDAARNSRLPSCFPQHHVRAATDVMPSAVRYVLRGGRWRRYVLECGEGPSPPGQFGRQSDVVGTVAGVPGRLALHSKRAPPRGSPRGRRVAASVHGLRLRGNSHSARRRPSPRRRRFDQRPQASTLHDRDTWMRVIRVFSTQHPAIRTDTPSHLRCFLASKSTLSPPSANVACSAQEFTSLGCPDAARRVLRLQIRGHATAGGRTGPSLRRVGSLGCHGGSRPGSTFSASRDSP